jgi:hypothetical protein
MLSYVIRPLTLAIYATALVVIPVMTAANSEASGRHPGKHHQRHHFGLNHRLHDRLHDSWASGGFQPAARPSYSGEVCPGNARSFDCKIWPPPMYDDPDRKISGSDGGG